MSIKKLLSEAAAAGDFHQVALCQLALYGEIEPRTLALLGKPLQITLACTSQDSAREQCEAVIADEQVRRVEALCDDYEAYCREINSDAFPTRGWFNAAPAWLKMKIGMHVVLGSPTGADQTFAFERARAAAINWARDENNAGGWVGEYDCSERAAAWATLLKTAGLQVSRSDDREETNDGRPTRWWVWVIEPETATA